MKNFIEELSYMKHLMLKLNTKLRNFGNGNQVVDVSKLDYFISLAEVVIFSIDYHTVNCAEVALAAKHALKRCVSLKK